MAQLLEALAAGLGCVRCSQTNKCGRAVGSFAPHHFFCILGCICYTHYFFVNSENLAQFMATCYNPSPGEAETPGAEVCV